MNFVRFTGLIQSSLAVIWYKISGRAISLTGSIEYIIGRHLGGK